METSSSPSPRRTSSNIGQVPILMNFQDSNTEVTIRGYIFHNPSRTSAAGNHDDGDYDATAIRVAFHVCRVHLSPPPSSSTEQEWQCTCEAFDLSELDDLRFYIPEYVLGRPILGEDDAASLIARIKEFARRAVPTEREFILQVDVNVLIDERTPQLGKRTQQAEEEAATCVICQNDFGVGDEMHMPPCGHPFHGACLGEWLQQNPRCPLCRSHVPFRPGFGSLPFIRQHRWRMRNYR